MNVPSSPEVCRDAVSFSGGECHGVTNPNQPPWWENLAYWPLDVE